MANERAPTAGQLVAQRREQITATLNDKRVLDQLQGVMPMTLQKTYTPERYVRLAMLAVSRNARLQECTPKSIVQAVVQLATWGLDCSGVTGEAYLVPFKNKGQYEATPITGFKGLITLAKRSGTVRSIQPNLVYKNDKFTYHGGRDTAPEHEWDWDDRGDLLGGYAVAFFTDGGVYKIRMSVADIHKHRDRSPSYRYQKGGPWSTDYEAMCLKTLVRVCSKGVPLSPELAEVMAHEDEHERVVESFSKLEVAESQPFGFDDTENDADDTQTVDASLTQQRDM